MYCMFPLYFVSPKDVQCECLIHNSSSRGAELQHSADRSQLVLTAWYTNFTFKPNTSLHWIQQATSGSRQQFKKEILGQFQIVYLLWQGIKHTPKQLSRQVELLFGGRTVVAWTSSQWVVLPPLLVVSAQKLVDESIHLVRKNVSFFSTYAVVNCDFHSPSMASCCWLWDGEHRRQDAEEEVAS